NSFTKEASSAAASVMVSGTFVQLETTSFQDSHHLLEGKIGSFGDSLLLVFSDVKLVDQTVEITASHAKSACAFSFSPAALAQDQIPFEPFDLLFVGRNFSFRETLHFCQLLLHSTMEGCWKI